MYGVSRRIGEAFYQQYGKKALVLGTLVAAYKIISYACPKTDRKIRVATAIGITFALYRLYRLICSLVDSQPKKPTRATVIREHLEKIMGHPYGVAKIDPFSSADPFAKAPKLVSLKDETAVLAAKFLSMRQMRIVDDPLIATLTSQCHVWEILKHVYIGDVIACNSINRKLNIRKGAPIHTDELTVDEEDELIDLAFNKSAPACYGLGITTQLEVPANILTAPNFVQRVASALVTIEHARKKNAKILIYSSRVADSAAMLASYMATKYNITVANAFLVIKHRCRRAEPTPFFAKLVDAHHEITQAQIASL